ncbi:MAG: S1/P1 nuclease [Legionella sp.]|uniref:S1/P1 nuclease n=1 Tax=Legionella sp. TaxID=459 RepID=UPI0039E4AAE2
MTRFFCILLLSVYALSSYAWNMQGHRVIAQVAFNHLTPAAKKMCHQYLKFRVNKSANVQFLAAATWLDIIRFRNIHWYDAFHYIDTPFSDDNTMLPAIENTNAVWGINNAIKVLAARKKKNKGDKRLALLILMHLVGDVHQPLHAATKVSKQLPHGDLGGNLFPLGANEVGNNLHKYWDNGAGIYLGRSNIAQIKMKAQMMEKKWPCTQIDTQQIPEQWARASYKLALTQVYQLNPNEIPGNQYQKNAQNIVQKQTVIAGCRLAALLNQIAAS